MFDQDPDLNVGFLLNDVSRLLRKRFDRRAQTLGLTRAQWRVLVHLAPRQGINQSALADILELDNVTLCRHIDRLEAANWLERKSDPGDRRAWRLHLTARAGPILKQMEVLAVTTQSEAMAGIGQIDRDRLMDTLMAIKDNLLEDVPDAGDVGESAAPAAGRRLRRA